MAPRPAPKPKIDDIARPVLSRVVPSIGWGIAGFLVGAIFWHFVGFWVFVSQVVLKGHPEEVRAVAQTGIACTELVLNRQTKQTEAVSCPADAVMLDEPRNEHRADSLRLTKLPTKWSLSISVADEASGETQASTGN